MGSVNSLHQTKCNKLKETKEKKAALQIKVATLSQEGSFLSKLQK